MNDISKKLNVAISLGHKMNLYIQTLLLLENEAEAWVSACQTLLEGYLPYTFVKPADLEKVISDIKLILSREHPSFTVSHENLGYFYQVRILCSPRVRKNCT